MKRRILSLLIILMSSSVLWFQSCSTNPSSPANTATADAAAGFEAYVGMTGATPAGCTPAGQGIIIVISAVVAADASGFFSKYNSGLYVNQPNLTTNILPQNYLLQNNPYEEVGIIHNNALNLIIERGGIDLVHKKLEENDLETWEAFFNLSPTYQNEFANVAPIGCGQGNRISQNHKQKIAKFTNSTNDQEIISFLEASEATKNFLLNIQLAFNDMIKSNKTNDEIYGYLNDKIAAILSQTKERTSEDEAALIYLTVLKHSNYYWNGK